ncbi:MAG TPA: DHH family phosphoesterase [Anaerolineales bacterium]|nr:DHH family phosphoesterase [Anaerolineales bacterium]HNA89445.1 DHH family phosphoesterase [Anaerolineales bacterium]HNB36662.1 DHH family phosphoesterase [Anaerolineales bacterium]HNC08084.1 DHH family phosphoesterase [Anaerolineales bacterium]
MNNRLTGEIKNRLDVAQNIVIASHVRPDGDAIGSLLGLGLALQNAGKTVEMILVDGVPSSFRFLEGSNLIKKEPSGGHDTFITVDCADFKRTGKVFENFGQPDINIDHHKTNEQFGKLNLIEAEEVATAAILTNHLPGWGLTITQPVAAALLTGILTDTLGFRTSNTTPEALRQAASLMESGVDMTEIYMQSLVRKTYPAAKYWGAGLSSLESKHGIVWGTLKLTDRKSTGYSGNDDADLINMISAIDGNQVGMVFVEQQNNHVKISWRALVPGVDVSQVAKFFKGGGHAAAAGADIEGTLDDIKQEALAKTRELLKL